MGESMKLLRVGAPGAEKPAILDDEGVLRDASALIEDFSGGMLSETIGICRNADVASLPAIQKEYRIGPCVGGVGKFICIGLNYFEHAKEAGRDIPTEPVIFMKATSAICGAHDPFEIPRGAKKCDWEAELGVVIGTRAKYISEEHALDHVAGYCVVNDGSERSFQSQRQGQWTKGKSHDSFGPIGPWLVTSDEITDPQALGITCDVDGKRYQTGSTADMIFPVAKIVSYLSEFMTLEPGDIIATGTPAGVGLGIKPDPIFLKAGQVIEIAIDGLGRQRHICVDAA